MQNDVIYEKMGEIGTIKLNNPAKGNPIGPETLWKLINAFKMSANNNDRVVLYKAEGKQFTFGANLKSAYELIVK